MTASHSPRPWRIHGSSIYAGAACPNFDSVAEINTDRPTAQAVANARLIAAAHKAVWRALGWDEESKRQDARLAAIAAREEK